MALSKLGKTEPSVLTRLCSSSIAVGVLQSQYGRLAQRARVMNKANHLGRRFVHLLEQRLPPLPGEWRER
jgi:hypothetical protein